MREKYIFSSSFKLSLIVIIFLNVLTSKASPNATISTVNCPSSINALVIKSITFPPYVASGDTFTGELANDIDTAIETCCPRIKGLVKFYNLDKNISRSDDIERMIRTTESYESVMFFPVFANRDASEQYDRTFLGLWESPGFAIIQVEQDASTETATDQIEALIKAWPILLVCVLTAILSGVIIWILDCRQNKEFSTGFISGAGAGIWWSFVTMTTVGYGDKSPKSFFGRSFAIIWMVLGTILLSMLSAQITSYLTSIEVAKTFTIQDEKVAVPLGLQNFLEKELNLAARYEEYPVDTIIRAVRDENTSYLDGRKYVILHDYLNIQWWLFSRNKTIDIKHKMMISHRMYLGAVPTFFPGPEINAFYGCLQRKIRDSIAVRQLSLRAKYRKKLNKEYHTTQSSSFVQDIALTYLAVAAGTFVAVGLIWELSRRFKKRSAPVSSPK